MGYDWREMPDDERAEWEEGRDRGDEVAEFLMEVEGGESFKDGKIKGYQAVGVTDGKGGKGKWYIPGDGEERSELPITIIYDIAMLSFRSSPPN